MVNRMLRISIGIVEARVLVTLLLGFDRLGVAVALLVWIVAILVRLMLIMLG